MNSNRQIWTAYNELTRKHEIINIELAELLPGKQVIQMFWTNSREKYVTIPGASLYIVNAHGKLELVRDEE